MKKYAMLMIVLSIGFASCGDDDMEPSIPTNKENVNANLVGIDKTVSRLEMPHLTSRYDYICHKLTDGTVNYTLEYDRSLYHAHWVAYTYDASTAKRNYTSRTNAWAPDPDVERNYRLSAQYFQGFSRGHLVGSAERYQSRQANEQTFYMSNMSPMIGNFNSTYWGEIENKVRVNWGSMVVSSGSSFFGGTLYVVKGGTLDQLRRTIPVETVMGEMVEMAVPKYYWIACLFVSSSGNAKAIGFWLEHKDYNNDSDSYLMQLRRQAAMSIDELEKKTGIDFFCNLQDNVENHVEATYDISQWSGL